MNKTIFHYYPLIKHLAIREIKVRYKQSFLGFFWVILNPFFQMLIMSFVFSFIVKFPTGAFPYPLFVYAGLLPWILFSQSLTSGMNALVDSAPLIKKIYFPREVLLISTIATKLFDFGLASILLLGMMVFYGVYPTWTALFVIPILFVQCVLMLGISLILSVMNLRYRDIQYLFTLILSLWFYLTPIVYLPEQFPPEYRWIFKLNPMSVFINAYREVLYNHHVPNLSSLAIGVAISFTIFIIGYIYFKREDGNFADIV